MQLYNEDCYKGIKRIPDKSVDLVVTDPPYKIEGLEAKAKHMTGMFKDRSKTHVHEMASTNLGDGINLEILDELCRVMKKINIYLWCNKEQIYDYMTYFVKERKCNFEIIVWGKPNPAPFTNGHYLKDKEYCLFFWEKGVKIGGNYDTLKTYYVKNTNTEDKKKYLHPTIKPLDIIKNLITNSCNGGCVLDCFMGSGTTGVACKELGLDFIGFELNKKYFDIAVDRINGISQKDREIEATGQMRMDI